MTQDLRQTNSPVNGAERGVTVLLITESDNDHQTLRDIFSHSTWTLARVHTAEEGLKELAKSPVPVVILGASGAHDNWDALRGTAAASPCPPKVIASVRFSEANRWMQLIDSGVFDVLPRPYDPTEVFQVVGFAWLEWRRAQNRSAARVQHSEPAPRPAAFAAGAGAH